VADLFEKQFRMTVDSLSRSGVKVVLVEEVPYPSGYHPWRAAYAVWRGRDPGSIGLSLVAYQRRNERFSRFMDKISIASISRIRTSDYFCSDEFCPAINDGISIYKDLHHLTSHGSMMLLEPIEDQFQVFNR